MNCDVCQTEKATIFFSQMVEGKLQKVNLCKSCADEKGVTDPTGYELANMLAGMGKESEPEKPASSDTDELTCDSCGFTQTDFKKTGRFGCANCYYVFDDGLDSLLEAMHKHTQHKGKVPASFPNLPEAEPVETPSAEMEKSPLDKLSELKESLSKSVEDEDYEEAARIRDEISQLESQLGDS
ncbi:MAG: excinuclease ABC subunit B [Verrucomicrobiales bacterium]|nr:excinuclease ABC subunit B [Verrucomicrobiales bacterium]